MNNRVSRKNSKTMGDTINKIIQEFFQMKHMNYQSERFYYKYRKVDEKIYLPRLIVLKY